MMSELDLSYAASFDGSNAQLEHAGEIAFASVNTYATSESHDPIASRESDRGDPGHGIRTLRREYADLARHRDELEIRCEQYRELFEHAPVPMLCFDSVGVITAANATAALTLDLRRDKLIGKPGILIVSQRCRRTLLSHIKRIATGVADTVEVELLSSTGVLTPVLLRSAPILGSADNVIHCQSVAVDISERKEAEEQLESARDHLAHLAHHDPLTGLPNRRLFMDRLEQALIRSRRHHSQGALLFLDLDNFKTLNDSLGHEAGDALLMETGSRLRHAVREQDTVCRLGGDEFTVILEEINGESDASSIASKILFQLGQSMIISGRELRVGTSIGIRVFDSNATSSDDLIRHADIAMYSAKSAGRNTFIHYRDHMLAPINKRAALASDLFHAVNRKELELVYQPQVDSQSREIVGVEALVRWNHPRLGMLMPADFIHIAEEGGQIRELGEWVLRHACTQFASWREQGISLERLAVNLSPQQFEAPDLLQRISLILQETRLNASSLELELTEGTVTRDPVHAASVLQELSCLGVQIAVDDFGTGYSSLSQLKRFPLNRLKIDSSFVTGIPEDTSDRSIASTIITMAGNLNLSVVSEGVETEAQASFLRDEGCDTLQGFHIAHPMTGEEIATKMLN